MGQPGHQLESLRDFARSVGVSEEIAISVYEEYVEHLSKGAHVQGYIGVRAEKHAREALRKIKLQRLTKTRIR